MRAEFTAIIRPAQEGGYWAVCPEVPGANGQGETIEEAKESLREAIRLILYQNQRTNKSEGVMRKIEKVVEELRKIAKENIPSNEKYEKMKSYMRSVKKPYFYGEGSDGSETIVYEVGIGGSGVTFVKGMAGNEYKVSCFLEPLSEAEVIWEGEIED